MVDDGIEGDGSFSDTAVTDDQFPLSAPDRYKRIYGFEARLQRLFYGLALHNARSASFDIGISRSCDGAFAIEGVA